MRNTRLTIIMAATLLGAAGTPALAQSAVEARVDRLEREMRAVQRKVFPGGNTQFFTPEITAPDAATTVPGTPATSVVTDLTARVSALETQLASLTGQIEQNQYKLQTLEQNFAAYRTATDARLKALEGAAPPVAADAAPPVVSKPELAAAPPKPGVGGPKAPAGAAPKPPVDPARARAVAAVEKPATADPADDAYVYGYRLWQAKLYPEAEAQLMEVVAKYPKHRRASWAQNLLGRAYLDEGRPSLASHAFYDNYKNFQDGERTPDSLYYLGQSLRKLGKPASDVCKVYDELLDVYGTRITPALKADVMKARTAEKCKAS